MKIANYSRYTKGVCKSVKNILLQYQVVSGTADCNKKNEKHEYQMGKQRLTAWIKNRAFMVKQFYNLKVMCNVETSGV